jgi:hypothetical protein
MTTTTRILRTTGVWPPPATTRQPDGPTNDPHADCKSWTDNPCLHVWPAPYSWRPHMCRHGRGHSINHKCVCGQELPR